MDFLREVFLAETDTPKLYTFSMSLDHQYEILYGLYLLYI